MRKQSLNEHLRQFSVKRDKKVALEKTYQLKFEFYITLAEKLKISLGVFLNSINHASNFHGLSLKNKLQK